MIRTQIYLPEDTHARLMQIAREEKTTFSKLVRSGADLVVKKRVKNDPQKRAVTFLANLPSKYKTKLTGKQLVDLISKGRDE